MNDKAGHGASIFREKSNCPVLPLSFQQGGTSEWSKKQWNRTQKEQVKFLVYNFHEYLLFLEPFNYFFQNGQKSNGQ